MFFYAVLLQLQVNLYKIMDVGVIEDSVDEMLRETVVYAVDVAENGQKQMKILSLFLSLSLLRGLQRRE